jgi:predicted transcriptional regulator
MEQTNFTCRVDTDLKQAFLRAAKANDRPASVLIRDFMRDYVQRSIQGQQTSLPFDHWTPARKG